MNLIVCLVFCFVLFASCTCESEVEVQNHLKALRKELFLNRGYDPMARPVTNHSHTMDISIAMVLNYIKTLDIQANVLESDAIIYLTWTDHNLKWNPAEFDEIAQIQVHLEEIYRPDITLLNSVNGENVIRTSTHSDLILDSTGTVFWAPVISMKTICTVDLTKWPFDQQTCTFKFASWLNFASALNLSSESEWISLENFEPNPEWNIISTKVENRRHDLSGDLYPEVIFYLAIERNSTVYRYTIYLPVICALLISLVSLFVDIQDNLRFHASSLSVSLLVILLLYLGFKLGFGSFGIPKVIIYLGQMIVLVSSTLIWLFIARIFSKSTLTVPMSISQALKPVQQLMTFTKHDVESVRLAENGEGDDVEIQQMQPEKAKIAPNDNLVIIFVIDKLLFVVFLFLIIVLHN